MIEFAAEREQLRRAQVMGRHSLCVGGRVNGRECDRPGQGIDRAINKQDGLGVGNVFGQFRSPLMVGDDAQTWLVRESLLGPLGKPKPDAVISAQRVAASENEASGWGVSHVKIVPPIPLICNAKLNAAETGVGREAHTTAGQEAGATDALN